MSNITNSGTPAVTSAQAWKAKTTSGTPLTVPSGNVCLVRAPGLQAFVQHGMIPNRLMPIVQKAMKSGKVDDIAPEDIDDETMMDLLEMFNTVTAYCVVEPTVHTVPKGEDGKPLPLDQRDPELLYADEVDFQDQVFIFNVAVGGTADLEKFRRETEAFMEPVRPS